ncbi:MAG: hypothetical protein SFV55_02740 [Haliscomenobacter sp.]|uniref:hypothetical protein n=1 Tax=Haliscomenobacter sp. TaxID=2717303 RepID=UPI0029BA6C04|nr:hypothetical protein [Haliscomenobacter sp.]MDX2067312.1 hypothetical protein [Haliscomenobacter sp.]
MYYVLDEYRIAWFNPNLVEDPAVYSFHLFENIPFYYYQPDPEKKDYWRNCQEWANYLGSPVKAHEVFKVLYQTSPDVFLTAELDHQLGNLFPGNNFIKKLLQARHAEALAYLKLAMKAEFAHFSSEDPWGFNEPLFDFHRKITPLIRIAKEKIKKLNDSFLIRRYAYQLVVQYHYTGKGKQCLYYCNKYFDLNQTASILVPWAQLYKAGVMTGLGPQNEANYLLSRIFDLCESKKNRVYYLFNQADLEATLKFSKNAHEQAIIYTIAGLKNPGRNLNNLKKIVTLDPGSRYLPQLLTREINKLENWILTPQVTFFGGDNPYGGTAKPLIDYMPGENYALLNKDISYLKKNQAKDRSYLREVRNLIASLMRDPKFTTQDFGHLALAHLFYLDQQPVQAKFQLQKITKEQNPTVQLQKNIINLLILPEIADITSPQTKAEIAHSFKKIRAHAHLLDAKLRAYPKLMLHFSRLYQQKGDVVTAGLFYNRSQAVPVNGFTWVSSYYGNIHYFDRFASLSDLDRLIELAKKKNRTSFETLLTDSLSIAERTKYLSYLADDERFYYDEGDMPSALPSLEQLYDLKGTIAFRQNRLLEALSSFEKLPKTYWRDTYEFNDYLQQDIFADAQHFSWEGAQLKIFNKADMVRRMIQLQRQARQPGSKQAEACYLLANAYYNTSYWGKAWMMFSYGKSIFDYSDGSTGVSHLHFAFYPNAKTYFNVYYKMSRAIGYYQKALSCKPNSELAARTTYMLGHCISYANVADVGTEDGFYVDQKGDVSSFFSTFRTKYSHTLAYQECLKTCPELADYFKSR